MTSRRWQRPSAFALCLSLIGIIAFCALGVWQLDRAAQKERLLAAFGAARRSAASGLRQRARYCGFAALSTWRVTGHFLAERGYSLFDEQVHDLANSACMR